MYFSYNFGTCCIRKSVEINICLKFFNHFWTFLKPKLCQTWYVRVWMQRIDRSSPGFTPASLAVAFQDFFGLRQCSDVAGHSHYLCAFIQSCRFEYSLHTDGSQSSISTPDLSPTFRLVCLSWEPDSPSDVACLRRTLDPCSPVPLRPVPTPCLLFPISVKRHWFHLITGSPWSHVSPVRELHWLHLQKHVLDLFLTTSAANTLIQATVTCHLDDPNSLTSLPAATLCLLLTIFFSA